MLALRLVRLIEDHSEELAEDVIRCLQNSRRTSDLNKVPADELRARVTEILHHLSDWLLHKTDGDIEKRYSAMGARRASQGVSLPDVCWGMILIKERLWQFLGNQGLLRGPLEIYGELELLRLLDQFFDHAIGYCAEGYEQALALRVH